VEFSLDNKKRDGHKKCFDGQSNPHFSRSHGGEVEKYVAQNGNPLIFLFSPFLQFLVESSEFIKEIENIILGFFFSLLFMVSAHDFACSY
jgi:hypothetical protein